MFAGYKIEVDTKTANIATAKLRNNLKGVGGQAKISEKEMRRLESRMKKGLGAGKAAKDMESLARATKMTRLEVARFQAKVGNYSGALATLSGGAKKAYNSLFSLKTMFASMGAAMATGAIITAGKNFEQTMAIVRGVTGATIEEFDELSAAARRMGEQTEWSATQAGDSLRFLAMAGFTVQEAITALPSTLNLATAGNLELGRAADIASNAMTALGLSAEDLSRVNDVFVATATRSNSTVEMLAESFKYVAPTAKALGYEVEELNAYLGKLHDAGIQGSMAGTQLNQAMLRTHKVFKKLGIDGEGKSLLDALEAMKEAQWGVNEVMGVFAGRGGRAILTLMDMTDGINSLTEANKNSAGEAKRLADIMRDTVHGSFKRVASVIESVMLDIFEEYKGSLKELLQDTAEWIEQNKTGLVGFVTALGEGAKTATDSLAAIGGSLDAIRKSSGFIGDSFSDHPEILTFGMMGLFLFGVQGGAVVGTLAMVVNYLNDASKMAGMIAGGAVDFSTFMDSNNKDMKELIVAFERGGNAGVEFVEKQRRIKELQIYYADLRTELKKTTDMQDSWRGSFVSSFYTKGDDPYSKELEKTKTKIIEVKAELGLLQAQSENYIDVWQHKAQDISAPLRKQTTETLLASKAMKAYNDSIYAMRGKQEVVPADNSKSLAKMEKYIEEVKTLNMSAREADLYDQQKWYEERLTHFEKYGGDIEALNKANNKTISEINKKYRKDAINADKKAYDKRLKAMEDYKKGIQSYADDWADINKELAVGFAISPEANEERTDFMEVQNEWDSITVDIENAAKEAREIWRDASEDISEDLSDAFGSFIDGTYDSWDDLVDHMMSTFQGAATEIANKQIKMLFTDPGGEEIKMTEMEKYAAGGGAIASAFQAYQSAKQGQAGAAIAQGVGAALMAYAAASGSAYVMMAAAVVSALGGLFGSPSGGGGMRQWQVRYDPYRRMTDEELAIAKREAYERGEYYEPRYARGKESAEGGLWILPIIDREGKPVEGTYDWRRPVAEALPAPQTGFWEAWGEGFEPVGDSKQRAMIDEINETIGKVQSEIWDTVNEWLKNFSDAVQESFRARMETIVVKLFDVTRGETLFVTTEDYTYWMKEVSQHAQEKFFLAILNPLRFTIIDVFEELEEKFGKQIIGGFNVETILQDGEIVDTIRNFTTQAFGVSANSVMGRYLRFLEESMQKEEMTPEEVDKLMQVLAQFNAAYTKMMEVYQGVIDHTQSIISDRTEYEQALYDIQEYYQDAYDTLKELGASEELLLGIREQERQANEKIVNEFAKGRKEIESEMNQYIEAITNPLEGLALELDTVNTQFDAWISSLKELGASQAELEHAEVERHRAITAAIESYYGSLLTSLVSPFQELAKSIEELQAEISGASEVDVLSKKLNEMRKEMGIAGAEDLFDFGWLGENLVKKIETGISEPAKEAVAALFGEGNDPGGNIIRPWDRHPELGPTPGVISPSAEPEVAENQGKQAAEVLKEYITSWTLGLLEKGSMVTEEAMNEAIAMWYRNNRELAGIEAINEEMITDLISSLMGSLVEPYVEAARQEKFGQVYSEAVDFIKREIQRVFISETGAGEKTFAEADVEQIKKQIWTKMTQAIPDVDVIRNIFSSIWDRLWEEYTGGYAGVAGGVGIDKGFEGQIDSSVKALVEEGVSQEDIVEYLTVLRDYYKSFFKQLKDDWGKWDSVKTNAEEAINLISTALEPQRSVLQKIPQLMGESIENIDDYINNLNEWVTEAKAVKTSFETFAKGVQEAKFNIKKTTYLAGKTIEEQVGAYDDYLSLAYSELQGAYYGDRPEEALELMSRMQTLLMERYNLENQLIEETYGNMKNIEAIVTSITDKIRQLRYSEYNLQLPVQKAEIATEDYATLLQAARSGDAADINKYIGFIDTYLRQSMDAYKSNEQYQEIWEQVNDDLESLNLTMQAYTSEDTIYLQKLNEAADYTNNWLEKIQEHAEEEGEEMGQIIGDQSDTLKKLLGRSGVINRSLETINNSISNVALAINNLEDHLASAIEGMEGGGGLGGYTGGLSESDRSILNELATRYFDPGTGAEAFTESISELAVLYQQLMAGGADAWSAAASTFGLTTERYRADFELLKSILHFQGGGMAKGPDEGYPAILHGIEAVIPMNGANIPVQIVGGGKDATLLDEVKKSNLLLSALLNKDSKVDVHIGNEKFKGTIRKEANQLMVEVHDRGAYGKMVVP